MQIDGHHGLTYIAARLAGFTQAEAQIIAYSAQYVDDATNAGVIKFDNGAMYSRVSSAHKMLDYRNFDELANHQVWAPFHFLPGNDGLPAGENPKGQFVHKLVCKPDSHVAHDMLKLAIADTKKPYALHRLGITMHVYADTFAHQGFAGITHQINEVNDLESTDEQLNVSFFSKIKSYFVSEGYPLGHGAALSYPDRPYIRWQYVNGLGETVERNNQALFLEATDKMCRAMQCFKAQFTAEELDSAFDIAFRNADGIPEEDKATINELLGSIKDKDGETRHQHWLTAIEEGKFSFGAEKVGYIAKGKGSWKHNAIGQLKDIDEQSDEFIYQESFLTSDWKMFHDALQAHRFDILHDVLPKYGICAA